MDENLIIGKNAVREAVRSGRDIDCILAVKGSDSVKEILNQARRSGIVIKEIPQKKLEELCREAGYPGNPQGIAARIPAFGYSELDDVFALAEERGEPPFIVMLDGIKDPHNLGAIIRSAEALGAHGVIIPKRRGAGLTAAACKAACGAEEHIPVVKVTNLSAQIESFKQIGIWCAAADMDGDALSKTNLKGALCIVIGSEGEGVSRLVKEKCDFTVKIPMSGKVNSLNASVAAAIVMYEKTRQDGDKN